jgi:Uma2 family endonuclease
VSTVTSVPVREYLTTSYRPDCEYLDGELLVRNVGEWDHSKLQARLIIYLSRFALTAQVHVVPEQRVQVTPTRFRVPDVIVIAGSEPQEQILTSPPFLCIEILSREDRMSEMQERIDDYLRFGVPYVWVLDPRLKRAFAYTSTGFSQPGQVLQTENPALSLPLTELFS